MNMNRNENESSNEQMKFGRIDTVTKVIEDEVRRLSETVSTLLQHQSHVRL